MLRVPARGTRLRFTLPALRLLPRNLISRAAGRFAGLELPGPLLRGEIRLFARAFGVDLSEVRDPLESFGSLQDFFPRALRDGAFGESGLVRDGQAFQLKGRPYGLRELLGSAADAAAFEGGAYATLYLSPRDYHRFHTPCALRVERTTYLPGTLWPVNRIGLEGVNALFAQNERICAFVRASPGHALLCLVAVGATMVGKVRLGFDSLETNRPGAREERRSYPGGIALAKGAEWGRFEFGSTIVLLAPPGAVELEARAPGTPVRLGERIGRLALA